LIATVACFVVFSLELLGRLYPRKLVCSNDSKCYGCRSISIPFCNEKVDKFFGTKYPEYISLITNKIVKVTTGRFNVGESWESIGDSRSIWRVVVPSVLINSSMNWIWLNGRILSTGRQ
jgi:hypothetical protein